MKKSPFDHSDMANIKNYSGQNPAYTNNIPNILSELGMENELVQFNDAVQRGVYTTEKEIWRLVTDYPAVRDKFSKKDIEIIEAIHFKTKNSYLFLIDENDPHPFDHKDRANISNYTKKMWKILSELGMENELVQFNDAVSLGTHDTIAKMSKLVDDYSKVRDQLPEMSIDRITKLHYERIDDSLNKKIKDPQEKSKTFELQTMIPTRQGIAITAEPERTPEDEFLQKERLEGTLQLNEPMREICIALFEKEFCDETEIEFIRYIREKDFTQLCGELLEYANAEKGRHLTDSVLFNKYRNILGDMTDKSLIKPGLHTRFAKKIKHIFKKMKENTMLGGFYNENG